MVTGRNAASGSRIVQKTIALCAGLVAVGLAASAQAQAIAPYYPGTAYPGAMYPGAGPALPPYEIVTIVRSTGLEPLSRPLRQGPAYVLRAMDPAGQEMRVIADARSGRLLKVVPVAGARYVGPMTPPPYGVAPPPPAVAQQAAPPLPRPRPKVAAAEQLPAAETKETTGAITPPPNPPTPTAPPTPAADDQAE
jgi:hypothetical protein